MSDIQNYQLGPCEVSFDGVALGYSKGGVEVTYEPEYHMATVDQYGNSPIDAFLIGEVWKAKVPLAESTVDNLKVALPNGTEAVTGERVTIGKKPGVRMSTLAKELVLTPTDGDKTDEIVFHTAIVLSPLTIISKPDEPKVYEVEFTALVDTSKADGNLFGHVGDSAAS